MDLWDKFGETYHDPKEWAEEWASRDAAWQATRAKAEAYDMLAETYAAADEGIPLADAAAAVIAARDG